MLIFIVTKFLFFALSFWQDCETKIGSQVIEITKKWISNELTKDQYYTGLQKICVGKNIIPSV